MSNTTFFRGDVVRRRDAPDAVGVVVDTVFNLQLAEWQVKVRFGTAAVVLPTESVELLPDEQDPWMDLNRGTVATAATLRTHLTLERLHHPASEFATSFTTARTIFYPYQFKPLLKFLENPRRRLLVADEVGLGKTIEAGYVLREMRARGELRKVLVVVPARLRQKWRLELRSRFDEVFELVGIQQLSELMVSLERGVDPGDFNWIVSYETLRRRHVRDGLARLQPPLDLVILDEAHRVRNPETLQHAVSLVLADCAEALVFLTATPIQTGPDNLFTLLRLLEPDTFSDRELFARQLEAQSPIVQLLRLIRNRATGAGDFGQPFAALAGNPMTSPFTSEDFFASIVERCNQIGELSRAERIALERDVAELSLVGHLFTRSKKRDVMPDCPPRSPQSITLKLTPVERDIYNAVEKMCHALGTRDLGWGTQMALVMVHRYTASCIPAALEYFASRLGVTAESLATAITAETDEETGGYESERFTGTGEDQITTADDVNQALQCIVHEAAGAKIPDTKLAQFLSVLRGTWDEDQQVRRPLRKVVVFSYFKRTLHYLKTKLDHAGIRCALITGDVPFPEREKLIEEFRSEEAVRILLSSEVGSEGLDLQFASVVVNYDLPWNPMVVEQRIGRLDRIGQEASRIVVVNFAIEGTIEERILLRLYERIRIFEESIGDLDPILGARIEELAIDALSGRLTEQEQVQVMEETASAIQRQVAEAGSLGGAADALMAADQAFLDEIQSLVDGRKVPNAGELARLLRDTLSQMYPGTDVPATLARQRESLAFPDRLASDLLTILSGDRDATRFAALIRGGPFDATLDADTALRHRDVELIHRRHPLIRFVQRRASQLVDGGARSFAVRLPSASLGPGDYIFLTVRFGIRGSRPRNELVPFLVDLVHNTPVPPESAETALFAMMDGAGDMPVAPRIESDALGRARHLLEAQVASAHSYLQRRESNLAAARAARIRTARLNFLNNQVETAQRRLDGLQAALAPQFPVRMARVRLDKAKHDLSDYDVGSPAGTPVTVERQDVAVGFLRVESQGKP